MQSECSITLAIPITKYQGFEKGSFLHEIESSILWQCKVSSTIHQLTECQLWFSFGHLLQIVNNIEVVPVPTWYFLLFQNFKLPEVENPIPGLHPMLLCWYKASRACGTQWSTPTQIPFLLSQVETCHVWNIHEFFVFLIEATFLKQELNTCIGLDSCFMWSIYWSQGT